MTTRSASRLLAATALAACLAAAAPGPVAAQAVTTVERLLTQAGLGRDRAAIDFGTRSARRYAVVIGNGDYDAIPDLGNARADAALVADFLRGQGYLVNHYTDITKRGFEDAMRRVLFDVDNDTEVVVYFAGHGFQIGSENYLVPVDADLDSIYDVPFEAVSLSALVSIVGARARLQVVILDSCRDNPFAGRSAIVDLGADLREARTGFSSQAAPLNSMLVYSTAPGTVAFDGEGENSPFTAAFIETVSPEPDRLVKEVFEDVRRIVFEETGGRQVPWDSSTLIEPASFGRNDGSGRPIMVASAGTGQSRGVARLAVAEAEPDTAASPVSAEALGTIAAEFIPEVAIGPALVEAAGLAPGESATVLAGPETGHLMRTGPDGVMAEVTGQTLSAGELAEIVLVNRSVQIPAVSLDTAMITDSLTLGIDGAPRTVRLDLSVDPCDYQGGDFLDPEGMGVARYPYQLDPDAVIAACEEAVARAPEAGRFHYQLGRGYIADHRFDEAEAAFTRARDLGHTRGWHAVGMAIYARAFETGGNNRALPLSEESRALIARGVVEGDPYAMYSLGRDLLEHGANSVVQIEGYDLLTRSMEVGHTYAMTELARYYLDPESTYADEERGVRYLQEAAARDDIYGINSLAFSYRDGEGSIEADPARAAELFATAAEAGHPTAPYNLGRMLLDGSATGTPDPVAAVEQFVLALERGHALSGAMAAYTIGAFQPAGYDGWDAAYHAARGSALDNSEFAGDARVQLEALPVQLIDGGAQRLLRELGASDAQVDGQWGGQSSAAHAAALEARGIPASEAETDPVERAIQLGRLYWQDNPFRVDLF